MARVFQTGRMLCPCLFGVEGRSFYYKTLIERCSVKQFILKYRTRNEIVVDILSSAKDVEGVTKTRIMYHAFLSFAQLKDYMAILLENGMLEHIETNKYRTTAKGVKMLETCQKINDLVGLKLD